MPSQGPLSPGTAASESFTGSTTAWSSTSAVFASDDSFTLASMFSGSNQSEYLKATNFGFSIPAGATINGILLEIERRVVGNDGDPPIDNRVRLVKAGTVQSTDKASNTAFPASDAYQSYGGSSDLWGGTWSDSDINDTGFGAVIAAQPAGAGSFWIAGVDHMRITVTYTEAASGIPFTMQLGAQRI